MNAMPVKLSFFFLLACSPTVSFFPLFLYLFAFLGNVAPSIAQTHQKPTFGLLYTGSLQPLPLEPTPFATVTSIAYTTIGDQADTWSLYWDSTVSGVL